VITAVLLAAGLSSRMGQSKPLLPFGEQTIIDQILSTLMKCSIDEVLVVTGYMREAVEEQLSGWAVRSVFNPEFDTGEMLSSVQVGLRSASIDAEAAMILLGDQPSLEETVVEMVLTDYRDGKGDIVIPSYQMRRGHPIIIGRAYWKDILDLGEGETLRDFFKGATEVIHHVEVSTPTVLRDMDTPADYRRELADHLGRRQT